MDRGRNPVRSLLQMAPWLLWAALILPATLWAMPLSPAARARLGAGHPTSVLVEFDAASVERAATAERMLRHIQHDDAAILSLRSRGYAAVDSTIMTAASGKDATHMRRYEHFPIALWRLSSLEALSRLESNPLVRTVHQNTTLHTVSVSDLPFISQPQAAAEGATGAGTTIAVIDGGLVSNFNTYPDFGTCTAVGTPANTCRVVYNHDVGTSTETTHGTNVSAIALGVAGGAKLAMFDVFNGGSATASDILSAIDTAIQLQATYNIVAINMSLGDGSSNATQCGSTVSPFATAVANAKSAGIVTVAAAGNSGSKAGLSDPACVPDAVSVGAVYDAGYGVVTWVAPADSGGQCTDTSAADKVTCFSQSANYLSVLAPGTFVNAPTSAFQQSGTSQATPHVSGSVAVLRARYPAESLDETVQRLKASSVHDVDAGNGLSVPRLNLLAATNQGTALSLAGSGPATAVSGTTSAYTITVTNNGPLAATNVVIADSLPSQAAYISGSTGCVLRGSVVDCTIANLAVGASVTVTITVKWTASGSIYDTASVVADQIDSAAAAQQTLAFGSPAASADVPLPEWAYGILGIALIVLVTRAKRRSQWLSNE